VHDRGDPGDRRGDPLNPIQFRGGVVTLNKRSRKPIRRLEIPTKTQSEVLSALGHRIDDSGVLHSTDS